MNAEERFRRTIAGDAVLIATLTKAVKEQYGENGLAVLRNALEQTFRGIIPTIAREAGARTKDGGIADWAKLEKFLSDIVNMEHDLEVTPQRGVLRVSTCPYLAQYQRTFPEFCPEVLIGIERAIAGTINPKMKVRSQQCMTLGDKVCELVCELNEE